MNYELNLLLKETINSIIENHSNYSGIKSKIARILLGSNSQPSVLKWLDDKTNTLNFGIKPISRIAESAGYKLVLAIVPKNDEQITNICKKQNIEFATNLKKMIEDYLKDSTPLSKDNINDLISKYDEMFADIE